ncbi:MAG: Fe-S cluster assembly ATPase SufC [Alphaproteobacteria bacterium]|nr:Fe-S cluster assembly ATPase SufC [Alphaproteobacteria bacterium]
MTTPLLVIKDLHACVGDKEIIKGLSLTINKGEVHAMMGPNGAGKSSLSYVLSGKQGYEVTSGEIVFKGKNLLDMSVEERAREGVFLSLQYPVEIPGVGVSNFLKHSLNAVRKHNGEEELDTINFMKLLRSEANSLGINPEMLKRFVNVGFSGGEKKRFETLQMALLKPSFSILDEIDSGLDIDALKTVSEGVNNLRNEDNAFLLITHYQRLLSYIVPDVVHIFADGKIIKTGDKSLAIELEENGYASFLKED